MTKFQMTNQSTDAFGEKMDQQVARASRPTEQESEAYLSFAICHLSSA